MIHRALKLLAIKKRQPKTASAWLGAAMVELIIAVLVMAVVVSALAGSLLQGSGQMGRIQRREQAVAAHMNRLLQELKNYVTADPSNATKAQFAPHGCWNFCNPPPAAGACPPANCRPGWALDENPPEKDVSFLLPVEFQTNYNGKMKYTVKKEIVNGLELRKVDVELNWNEP